MAAIPSGSDIAPVSFGNCLRGFEGDNGAVGYMPVISRSAVPWLLLQPHRVVLRIARTGG